MKKKETVGKKMNSLPKWAQVLIGMAAIGLMFAIYNAITSTI